MARHRGFLGTLTQIQREVERQAKAQQRAQQQEIRAQERARRDYQRAQLADQKEQARFYTESRIHEVSELNQDLEEAIQGLKELLAAALNTDSYLDLENLKTKPTLEPFNPGALALAEKAPTLVSYLPPPLSGINQLLPWAKKDYDEKLTAAHKHYAQDASNHAQRESLRCQNLSAAKKQYDQKVVLILEQTASQNAQIDHFKEDFVTGLPDAVIAYFKLVLDASNYPEGFPQDSKVAYIPESKQLVVEYDLPPFALVPEVSSYKYIKVRDEIADTKHPNTARRELYNGIVAQIAIRTLHELFEADRTGHLDTIVFNGYVDSIDAGTGKPIRPCLVTVRTTKDAFSQLDLSRVDPIACLKSLSASVSKSPAELAPVRPVLEFNMVDSRFIEESDVISGLDSRTNLMELTPGEFEALISNLFGKMGLETRLTQASRDGGVDCVAYDPRPIFGGKVVIQAKRYKHTVGVSAVRDLYGTVQNEGASKGILVTTSGYGKAAYQFAEGKPLELLSGSHLLFLLAEHAGIEAKIEMPDNWKDIAPDSAALEENLEDKDNSIIATHGQCPQCGTMRPLTARHCGSCGIKLPWAQTVKSA
ncbi:MAG: restriction endonuclease [Abitibacteriaceae bacterium]|nr:restriction endonuclease [Abditibacteriaceae bacterium]